MPLIDKTTLLKVADRAAYQYGQLHAACVASQGEGAGFYFDIVSATEDSDVEIPLNSAYNDVDEDMLADFMVKYGTRLPVVVGAMETHFNRIGGNGAVLQVGGWDGYLTGQDERVSYYFAQLFFAVHGFYMLSSNVFSESVDQFGQIQVAAGPAVTFTDGINYGNGSSQNPANGTNYSATQLKVVVTSMGSSNLDIRLSVKDISNNMATIDVTIPGASAVGAEVLVGTSSDRFLDVTGAIFKPSGSTGTVGDDVRVVNSKERQIAL